MSTGVMFRNVFRGSRDGHKKSAVSMTAFTITDRRFNMPGFSCFIDDRAKVARNLVPQPSSIVNVSHYFRLGNTISVLLSYYYGTISVLLL